LQTGKIAISSHKFAKKPHGFREKQKLKKSDKPCPGGARRGRVLFSPGSGRETD
jgi:hypothetical protein